MSIAVAYDDFQIPNGALASEGGPWTVVKSTDEMYCATVNTSFCQDFTRCIGCNVRIAAPTTTYNVKYNVNISIPLVQYGNADLVDYTFSYNLNWASDKTSAGQPLTAYSTIGSSSNVNNFEVSDRYWLWYSSPTSLGDPVIHTGSTSVTKSTDGLTGFIPITIDFSFKRSPGADVTFYMKGATFQITTPPSFAHPSSSSSNIVTSLLFSASTVSPSSSLSAVPLPFPNVTRSTVLTENAAIGFVSSAARPTPPSTTTDLPIISSIAIGTIVAGLVVVGASAVALICLFRRKLNKLEAAIRNSRIQFPIADAQRVVRVPPIVRSESFFAYSPSVPSEYATSLANRSTMMTVSGSFVSLSPRESIYIDMNWR
ncbi:hypothetical protein FRC15_004887 [Serendipita sp. 397]|nr:hypothetical protein FRC15_004887 [Serendipita sp. 397]